MTRNQRNQVYIPLIGLTVFDTGSVSFFCFNGNNRSDLSASSKNLRSEKRSGGDICLCNLQKNLGIETYNPVNKTEIVPNSGDNSSASLLEIVNEFGKSSFSTCCKGLRLSMKENKYNNISRGFAIGYNANTGGFPGNFISGASLVSTWVTPFIVRALNQFPGGARRGRQFFTLIDMNAERCMFRIDRQTER